MENFRKHFERTYEDDESYDFRVHTPANCAELNFPFRGEKMAKVIGAVAEGSRVAGEKVEALLIQRHYAFRYCSPARRSFLTGRLPPHVGQKNTPDAHIDFRMRTIAERLADAGYATGRWRGWRRPSLLRLFSVGFRPRPHH